ncbi:MAG TPA: helix-turn-helix transcriptional regulator [Acidimicrobiia bacterium]|jgi:transcriptional regulator with XRE-family HTH domain|nr:helix-turn-helix transcriptional regulator [Acidimicrobiia bacterium]
MSEPADRVESATRESEPPARRRRRLRSASTPGQDDFRRREPLPWAELSRVMSERREDLGLSRREAARRAHVSEREWKLLESGTGVTRGSVRIMPNVGHAELERIADALELPPAHLAGTLEAHLGGVSADSLCARITRLGPADRRLVEQLIDRLVVTDRSVDRTE